MRSIRRRWRLLGDVITRLIRRPLGLVSLLGVLGLGLAEIASKNVRHIYTTYPASLSLLTGFVALAFTVSVVDEIVEERASSRWQDVRGITLKGLNDEIRAARDILWLALFGRLPYSLPYEMSKQTQLALKRVESASYVWPGQAGGCRDRLNELMADRYWTAHGAAILHLATQQIREGLVRWAPMTALARGDHRVLSPVARVADAIELLEFPLAADLLDKSGCVEASCRSALCDLWCHTLCACVYIEENIVRVLYPARNWTSRARELLSTDEVGVLSRWLDEPESFARDTTGQQSRLANLLPNWQGNTIAAPTAPTTT